MPNCLTSGVQRSTYQPNLRVGKPLFCEAWRLGFSCGTGVCTLLPAEEASGKRTKMSMLTLLVAWGWRGKTRSANQKRKTEKPIVPSVITRHSRFFSSVSNSDNNSTTVCADPAHPLRPVVCLSGNASHLPQAFCLRHKPPRLRQQRRA